MEDGRDRGRCAGRVLPGRRRRPARRGERDRQDAAFHPDRRQPAGHLVQLHYEGTSQFACNSHSLHIDHTSHILNAIPGREPVGYIRFRRSVINDTRPGWDAYFLSIAHSVAGRADCTRRKCGAVIVRDRRIVATGYNGAPAGQRGCLEGGCPRGLHYPDRAGEAWDLEWDSLVCGGCRRTWPCADSVLPGSSYDTGPGMCTALHAELNACIYAGRCPGATIYITDEPCDGCCKVLAATGIVRAVWPYGVLTSPFLSCYNPVSSKHGE